MSQRKAIRCILALNALKELKELINEEENKRKLKLCVNPFIEKREPNSLEQRLLKDILWEDDNESCNFCRMTVDKFEELLALVDLKIRESDAGMRYAITSRVRLAITLRYIVSGDSYRSLEFLSHISRKAIAKFVPDVLHDINDAMEYQYLKTPSTKKEWSEIANDFETLWHFPHTLGTVDGKLIQIKTPPKAGCDNYGAKRFFSIALISVVDAHSRFVYIDVDGNGGVDDAAAVRNCSLYKELQNGKLNIPLPSPLKGQRVKTPFFFIGDNIFGLDQHIVKGYDRCENLSTSQEIFNYRLGRARLTAGIAIGRLTSRFRVFHRPLEIDVDNCMDLVETCCILHNYLTQKKQTIHKADFVDYNDHIPETIIPLSTKDHKRRKYSSEVRENVNKYFMTDVDEWDRIKK